MLAAASARFRRIVACIVFTIAAIDGDRASLKLPSEVCADAARETPATHNAITRTRRMEPLLPLVEYTLPCTPFAGAGPCLKKSARVRARRTFPDRDTYSPSAIALRR